MLVVLLAATAARAGPVEIAGFGGAAAGRAGAVLGGGPEQLFAHPAALHRLGRARAGVGYAVVRSDFEPFPPLRWDTNRDGVVDELDEPLDAGPVTDRADGFMFSLARPLGRRAGLALAAFLPVDRVLRIQTFEPALPTYFLYENRLNRYDLAFGAGWEQLPGLALGGGVEVIARARYEMSMTFDATLHTAGEGDDSAGDLVGDLSLDVHRMSLDIVPAFAPVASAEWDLGRSLGVLEGLRLLCSWRGAAGLPVEVDLDIQADIALEDAAGGVEEPFVVTLLLPLRLDIYDHYLPARWTFGAEWDRGGALALTAEVHRTAWQSLALSVTHVSGGHLSAVLVGVDDVEVADGNEVAAVFRPTVGARVGLEVRPPLRGAAELALRAGAAYEPTPLVSQGPETALLDADRAAVALGVGLAHPDPLHVVAGPVRWDAFAQLHALASGELPVADPDRAGAPVDGGAIPVGGRLLVAGLEWSIAY